jgi:hypothetical protein
MASIRWSDALIVPGKLMGKHNFLLLNELSYVGRQHGFVGARRLPM